MRFNNSILARLHNDWHFLLLIIFFITHGYAEHAGLISVSDLILLLIGLVVLAMLLYWLCKLIFKDSRKAALFVTFSMALFLFFGAFQDFIGSYQLTAALAQLKIFFPVSLAAILVFFIFLKRTRYKFTRLNIFLNVLLAMYIIVDIGVIGFRLLAGTEKNNQELAAYGLNATPCDTCRRPPVYYIVLDEYSGSPALKGYFNYDNSPFEQFLESEGFKVNRNATSNYFFTIYSIASTLNMDYIPDLGKQSMDNHYGYRHANRLVIDNVVTRFFKQQGYHINNYSYLQLRGAPVVFKSDYLPVELDLITGKTMYSRVANNLMRFLGRKFSVSSFKQRRDEFYISNNETMMQMALLPTFDTTVGPSFTYMHLMMPHEPIAFDSLGRRITPFWERKSMTRKEADDAYLQYLVYTNNRMRSFITALKKFTKGEAIILLMGDHGYRRIPANRDWGYHTLSAVYIPEKNYDAWYDGMSNVNQFRALLNTSFGQRLPMLKDSLVR
ncbi:MAG TPA: hypothetical protein VD993_04645 [Chitinophagaceae bacterium]|nr:hypothetical protein [Chitinophagaceae bacterium]